MRSFLVAASLLALAVVPVLTPACVVPDISTGADAGTAAASSSGTADGGAPTTQGASCTQVSSTIALCQYISSCPNLVLNAQVLPQCGFRIHGDAIDPECLCGNYICPIGSPTTCAEAASMAGGDTTYDSVCEQSLEGHCLALGSVSGSASSSSSSSGSSSACQTCIQNCDNVPSCIDTCGC